MKISNTMPHLKSTRAIIIVCGQKTANIYTASNEIINVEKHLEQDLLNTEEAGQYNMNVTLDYKGHAKTMKDNQFKKIQDRLIKSVVGYLKNHRDTSMEFLVLCPRKISKRLIKEIEHIINTPIYAARYGNYIKFRTDQLAEKLEAMFESKLVAH